MKFYNREKEIEKLAEALKLSRDHAQMTFVVGRRRIGKTRLLLKAYEQTEHVYFFVAKKSEALLCAEFTEEIRKSLALPVYGEFRSFSSLFELLMEEGKRKSFTVIIDEFQEFMTINSSLYSDLQRIWDKHKEESKLNLVVCGSVYSLMTKIFENAKEPLFGRATQRLYIQPFDVATVKTILSESAPNYTKEDLLTFYMVTGGVAKYVELLVQNHSFTKGHIISALLSENSMFLEEGKNVLIEEFGKEYGNYFSILSLIAGGKTSRVEIESILDMEIGGYLSRLENEYKVIRSLRPVLAKPGSRSVKYKISDKFLSFWFRFIYKYRSAIEAGNLDYVKEIVASDYNTYSGIVLEDYFMEKIKAEKKYNLIGSYWEKKNLNEIDIVAINDLEKHVLIAEVKRNSKKIDLQQLKEKAYKLQEQLPDYTFSFKGFSLDEM
jgi:AAA+ ATPase superfamily predicted ATPase